MSDENRREELKAKINEQPDKLSVKDLETVAGGRRIQLGCKKYGATFDKYVTKCPKCGSTKLIEHTPR